MPTKQDRDYLAAFDMPKVPKIVARLPVITGAFANAIVPVRHPSAAEVKKALDILAMIPRNVRCAYCGDPKTEWDHLRPTIKDRKPTGYITQISNLVPACGKCNQSKTNKRWDEWISGPAARSPASRGIKDLDRRIDRLKVYETAWDDVEQLDLAEIVGHDRWAEYWQRLDAIEAAMREAQEYSLDLREAVRAHLDETGAALTVPPLEPSPDGVSSG